MSAAREHLLTFAERAATARRVRALWLVCALSLWLVYACSKAPHEAVNPPVRSRESATRTNDVGDARSPLIVTIPRTLEALESSGFDLASLLGGRGPSLDALTRTSPRYADLVRHLEADESTVRGADPLADDSLGASHRLFSMAWLRHEHARFELVAVVNRLDRRLLVHTGCGEVRFIYRLAYDSGQVRSRLPMTLNLVVELDGDCRSKARGWLALEGASDLARALRVGPLHALARPARIEVNFQSARWPSGVRPDLGGHAEYVLRVFRIEAARMSVAPLENTPSRTLDDAARRALIDLLVQRAPDLDAGTLRIDEAWLARRSVSVSPHGLARLANRPFLDVLGGDEGRLRTIRVADLPLSTDATEYLRRLDTLSCKGCHQSRSLAGFHVLGEERDEATRANALVVGVSPHVLAELAFRRDYLEHIANGRGEFARVRPLAERGDAYGGAGARCRVGGDAPALGCDDGLRCRDLYHDGVGACGAAAGNHAGDAVESMRISRALGREDRVTSLEVDTCRDELGPPGVARSSDGFPSGMCHAECTELGREEGEAICAPVPFGTGSRFQGFDDCLFKQRRPFTECLADDARPTWLRVCDAQRPCRDDYVCARVPNARANVGACIPTYFLFQVRVDGHRL